MAWSETYGLSIRRLVLIAADALLERGSIDSAGHHALAYIIAARTRDEHGRDVARFGTRDVAATCGRRRTSFTDTLKTLEDVGAAQVEDRGRGGTIVRFREPAAELLEGRVKPLTEREDGAVEGEKAAPTGAGSAVDNRESGSDGSRFPRSVTSESGSDGSRFREKAAPTGTTSETDVSSKARRTLDSLPDLIRSHLDRTDSTARLLEHLTAAYARGWSAQQITDALDRAIRTGNGRAHELAVRQAAELADSRSPRERSEEELDRTRTRMIDGDAQEPDELEIILARLPEGLRALAIARTRERLAPALRRIDTTRPAFRSVLALVVDELEERSTLDLTGASP